MHYLYNWEVYPSTMVAESSIISLHSSFFYLSFYAATQFGSVGADAFKLMMTNVDLESPKQSELAQNVLSAMLLGPPTTTPAIPTRTVDPDASE